MSDFHLQICIWFKPHLRYKKKDFDFLLSYDIIRSVFRSLPNI